MSMCYHYFHNRIEEVLPEFDRVLCNQGLVVIRNATKEDNMKYELFNFFPAAKSLSIKRIPSEQEIIEKISKKFYLIESKTVTQLFAKNNDEYYSKIKLRGLSSLRMIDDSDFYSGLSKLKGYLAENRECKNLLYEDIHLFIFQKR